MNDFCTRQIKERLMKENTIAMLKQVDEMRILKHYISLALLTI